VPALTLFLEGVLYEQSFIREGRNIWPNHASSWSRQPSSLLGQRRIAAGNEPLAGKVGRADLGAAALYVLSENRKTEDVVGKLNPSELERVIDVIGHQPDRFPPATLAALKESRPTPPEVSFDPPGAGSHFRGRARLRGAMYQRCIN
jgi:hypothetical protein